MIDEHAERMARERVLREFWTKGRIIVVATAAFVMWAVTLVSAVVQLGGH